MWHLFGFQLLSLVLHTVERLHVLFLPQLSHSTVWFILCLVKLITVVFRFVHTSMRLCRVACYKVAQSVHTSAWYKVTYTTPNTVIWILNRVYPCLKPKMLVWQGQPGFTVCHIIFVYCFVMCNCLQCFDAVGWVAGRASVPYTLEYWGAGMVICLEWSAKTCLWSRWCHCHLIISASVKSRMVHPSGTGLPR